MLVSRAVPAMTPGAARISVLLAALLFSTGGAAIKATSLGPWAVAGLRSAFAFVFLLVALPEARRRWNLGTLALGLSYGATMVLFVAGNKLTTAANTIFLQSTAPLYLLLAGPWLLGERVRRRDLGFMAALAAGMALFFAGEPPTSASAPNPALGNWIALASGVTWAGTIGGLRWMEKHGARGEAARALAAGNLLAFLACLAALRPLPAVSGLDWTVVAYLGIFQIGLAYLFFTRGLRGLPALEVSLLVLIEPVLNPLWAWLLQGERPGGWAIAGGTLILAATAWRAFVNRAVRGAAETPGEGETPA